MSRPPSEEGDIDVSHRDRYGRTPLALALQQGNVHLSEQLLRAGADPNALDNDGDPVVLYALKITTQSLLTELIRATRPPFLTWRTLFCAVVARNEQFVEQLLNHGLSARHDMSSGACNILTEAVKNGSYSIVRLLIVGGIDINARDRAGLTPLMLAIQNGHTEICTLLLDVPLTELEGLTPDGRTILELTLEHRDYAAAEKIIERAPVLLSRSSGRTPLQSATDRNDIEAVKFLLSRGADPLVGVQDGETPFLDVCQHDKIDIAHALIQHISNSANKSTQASAFFSGRDSQGNSALHKAVQNESIELLRLLLSVSVLDVGDQNKMGLTPLHLAVSLRLSEMVKILLAAKSPLQARTVYGMTALDLAVSSRNEAVIALLLSMNAPSALLAVYESLPEKWANEPWFRILQERLEDLKVAPSFGRYKVEPSWRRCQARSTEEKHFTESNPDEPYCQVLVDAGNKEVVRRVVFTITSNDQGRSSQKQEWHGSYAFSHTWFEAAVLAAFDRSQPPRIHVQSNIHASKQPRTHVVAFDFRDPDPRVRAWVESLHRRAIIRLHPKAQYPGWCNSVHQVEIDVYIEPCSGQAGGDALDVASTSRGLHRRRLLHHYTPGYLKGLAESEVPSFLRDTATHIVFDISQTETVNQIESFRISLNDSLIVSSSEKLSALQRLTTIKELGIRVLGSMHHDPAEIMKVRRRPDGVSHLQLYEELLAVLKSYQLDGIQVEYEEQWSFDSVVQLIDRLRNDLGSGFLISLSCTLSAFQSSDRYCVSKDKESLNQLETLEIVRGEQVDWYATRPSDSSRVILNVAEVQGIAARGWPLNKIVLGLSPEFGTDSAPKVVSPAALGLFFSIVRHGVTDDLGGVALEMPTTGISNAYNEHSIDYFGSVVAKHLKTHFSGASSKDERGHLTKFLPATRRKTPWEKAQESFSRGSPSDTSTKIQDLQTDMILVPDATACRQSAFSLDMSDIMAHIIVPALGKDLRSICMPVTDAGTVKLIENMYRNRKIG